jgi:predicted NBD/HSP70 family sugar kinase
VPGTAARDGSIVAASQLGWSETPLRELLEDIYALPCYVIGDAEASAVAEVGRTGSDPSGRLLYVKVDDRISAAVVTNDQLNRTPVHGGDLTHLRVSGWADECRCGQKGCLGTRVSMIEVLGSDQLEMSTEARKRLAVETTPRIDRAAEYLGRALAPIVMGIDVDRVVVGGELGEWASVPQHVAAGIEAAAGWCPEVTASRLGSSAVVLGAAAVVLSGELGVVWG